MSETILPDDVKLFIVQAAACFDTPSEVARNVKAEFGIDVSRQAVEAYDPTKRAGQRLSEEYRKIFEAVRNRFLADTAEIGVSHRSVRLRTIQRLSIKAETMGNLPLVSSLLEQAAKEVGNVFTNKTAITADLNVKKSGPDLSGLNNIEKDTLLLLLEKAEQTGKKDE